MRRIVSATLLAVFWLGFSIPLLASAREPACEMSCCRGASCSREAHSSHGSTWAATFCLTSCASAVSAGVSHGLLAIETPAAAAAAPLSQPVVRLPEPPASIAGYRVYLYQRPPPIHLAF